MYYNPELRTIVQKCNYVTVQYYFMNYGWHEGILPTTFPATRNGRPRALVRAWISADIGLSSEN